MIETKDITKMVKHILRRDKGIADTQIMHPAREWFTGLGAAVLLIILGSWFCFYLYHYYSREMQKEAVIIEQSVPYQATTVKSAIELFASKQKKFEAILGGEAPVTILLPEENATTTTAVATSTEEIPELIIDPPPLLEDEVEDVTDAMLAP